MLVTLVTKKLDQLALLVLKVADPWSKQRLPVLKSLALEEPKLPPTVRKSHYKCRNPMVEVSKCMGHAPHMDCMRGTLFLYRKDFAF